MGLRVLGLGFRVQSLGFRVQGLGFRVSGPGYPLNSVCPKLSSQGFCVVVGVRALGVQGFKSGAKLIRGLNNYLYYFGGSLLYL